jgi:hypothetical protein
MDGSFWDDICVEAVTEIDGINVVTVQSQSQHACLGTALEEALISNLGEVRD